MARRYHPWLRERQRNGSGRPTHRARDLFHRECIALGFAGGMKE